MRVKNPRRGVIAVTAMAAASLAVAAEPAAIQVDAQALESGGLVTVAHVTTPRDGFLVIRAREGEKPGAVLGRAPVAAGDNMNVAVKLERDVRSGTTLLAVLHEDTGEIGAFEYEPAQSGADMPMMQGERMLAVPFTVK